MQTAKPEGKAYGLSLQRRERLTLTGVKDVLAFDESQVLLLTEGGELTILGQTLHVDRLSLEAGEMALTGTVDSLAYGSARGSRKSGWAARLLK